jgi:hypothetical protein
VTDGAPAARSCVFCQQCDAPEPLAANDLAIAFPAGFPVSPGHALIVPRRHEPDFFALTAEEQGAVVALVNPVRAVLGPQPTTWASTPGRRPVRRSCTRTSTSFPVTPATWPSPGVVSAGCFRRQRATGDHALTRPIWRAKVIAAVRYIRWENLENGK